MKWKNRIERLNGRRKDYENLMTLLAKEGRVTSGFRRPGSMNK